MMILSRNRFFRRPSLKRALLLFAAAALNFSGLAWWAEQEPLAMRVEHFYLASDHAQSLFAYFKDTFQLPEVWPYFERGTFASGGLSLGNAVLEFASFPRKGNEALKTGFRGIAFEPTTDADATAAELTRRNIPHTDARTHVYQVPGGQARVEWSSVMLTGFPPTNADVFFCDYKDRKAIAARRKVASDELAAKKGGPLGIVGAAGIIVGVQDLEDARNTWSALLSPSPQISDETFIFNSGPRIRLVRAEAPGIQGVILSVRSLAEAEKFLRERGLLAKDDAGRIAISPAAIDGLAVELQEIPQTQREAPPRQEVLEQTPIDKWARVLVRYSLDLRAGESFLIRSEPDAQELILAVYKEALLAGAYPYIRCDLPGRLEILFRTATDEQLANLNGLERLEVGYVNAALLIEAPANTKELTGVDPKRQQIFKKSEGKIAEIAYKRFENNELRRCITAYPTNALAQEAEMGLGEFRDFVFNACKLNEADPAAAWKSESIQQHEIARRLQGKDNIFLKGPNIDLRLSIKGRPFVVADGKVNFPDGEIFTSPLEDSADGWVRFSYPAVYDGRQVDHVELWFQDGKVVREKAAQGQDFLTEMLNTDEGARRLGELGIGTNYGIKRFTKNMLFDEKMGGTIHLALGHGFPQSGGVNVSAIHWDMLCDMSQGDIYVDGELFYKNGRFVK